MNRRSLLQALATTPLVWFSPGAARAVVIVPLFLYRSDEDYVIARDPADAATVFVEETGPYAWVVEQGQPHGIDPADWLRWPDDKPFTLTEDIDHEEYEALSRKQQHGELFDVAGGMIEITLSLHFSTPRRYTRRVTALPRWWVKSSGRCLLASRDG